jgi:uncharacterized protein YjbI with pentapeptide repeats
VYSPVSGETLPLEEELWSLVECGASGAVQVTGAPGSGKRTTLQHLAAVFAASGRVICVHAPNFVELFKLAADHLVVSTVDWNNAPLAVYRLAPWGKDEFIEYLLSEHKDCCAPVMARLQPGPGYLECGDTAVWRAVLDRLASDAAIPDARTALIRHIHQLVPDVDRRELLFRECLGLQQGVIPFDLSLLTCQPVDDQSKQSLQLLQNPYLQMQVAAECIVLSLKRGVAGELLERSLPRAVVNLVARLVAPNPRLLRRLKELLEGPSAAHPMVASLLHVAQTGWVPEGACNLTGAYLQGAAWPDVRLEKARLDLADLSGAYLARACLNGAHANAANFSGARLGGASLEAVDAGHANFSRADLSHACLRRATLEATDLTEAILDDADLSRCKLLEANLTGASLRGASLNSARLVGAKINNADFAGANLESAVLNGLRLCTAHWAGASFQGAQLTQADLEYMELPGVCFAQAKLQGALLTGSVMPEADFTGACLSETGLADVEWEGACLRGADLRGASFHMGSSRSGRVGSPIACEGSRTGFYTDDYEEQHFKSPEEIRKANLRGADLRGAQLDNCDFYLVDLRDALFDPEREANLRHSGAILNDWKPC